MARRAPQDEMRLTDIPTVQWDKATGQDGPETANTKMPPSPTAQGKGGKKKED